MRPRPSTHTWRGRAPAGPGPRSGTCGASPDVGSSRSSARATSGDIYTVTVDERSLLEGRGADGLSGSTVQAFPVDPKLPHLDTVMAPSEHADLAAALESTARTAHDVPPDRQLLDVVAEPVRYKPGDRCVLRYRLRFGGPGPDGRHEQLHRRRQAVPGALRGAGRRRPPGPAARPWRRSPGPPGHSAWCPACRWR